MRGAPETENGKAGVWVLGGKLLCSGAEGRDGERVLHRRGQVDVRNCSPQVNEEIPAIAVRFFSCYCLSRTVLVCSSAEDAGLVY